MAARHLAILLVLAVSYGAGVEVEWRELGTTNDRSCVSSALAGDRTLGTASCSGLPLERAVFSCLVTADGSEVPAPRILVAQQDNALISSGGTAGSGPGPPSAANAMPSSSSYASSGTNASSITAISGTKANGSASSASSGGASSGGVLDQMAGYLAAALPGRGVAVEQMSIDAFEEQLFRGDGWAANSSGVAGLPVSPVSTYLLADRLAPLGALLSRDARLQWSDFNAFFRTVAAVYDGGVISVPYTAEIPLLFYRTDVFAERGLRPPATWHEYLHLAGQLHGQAMPVSPDSNSTIAGWCESFPTGCSYDGITLTAIWTSFVARQGPQAGAFFDPQTMSPRLAGAGMAESIRVFRELHEFELEPHPPDCLRNSLELILQRCALFPAVSTLWKHVMLSGGDFLRGRLGVARLPGSELVEDPSTGMLVPCTEVLCPYGELTDMQSPPPSTARFDLTLTQEAAANSSPPTAAAPARLPDNSSGSGSGTGGASQRRTLLAPDVGSSRRAWVNFAPFLGRGAVSMGVSVHANPMWQYAAWRAISAALAPEAMWTSLLDPTTAFSPVRDSHMDKGNVDRWVAAGYDRGAALGYLTAFRGVVLHPNAVMSPRIPGSEHLVRILASLSSVLQYNSSVSEAELVRGLRADLRLAFNSSDPALRQRYRADIGYTPASSIADPAAQAVGNGLTAGAIAGIVVGTVAGTVLIGVLCVLLGRGYNKYRSHLVIRMSSAPTYGHDTSLMITDIMDSTKLWEQVDESVMDTSLDMHNRTIRHLLPRYGAYECHTEGDSFILAFHTAADAVACALEIQVALLHLDWPEELLLADACRPVLALPPPTTAAGPSPSTTTRGGFLGGGGGSRILAGAAAAIEHMGGSSRTSLDTALPRAPGYGMAADMAMPQGLNTGLSANNMRQLSGGASSPYRISGSGIVAWAFAGRPSGTGAGVGASSRQPSSNLFHLGSQGQLAAPNRSGDGRVSYASGAASGLGHVHTEGYDGTGSPQAGSSNVSNATPRRIGRRRTHGDFDAIQPQPYITYDRNVFDPSENGIDLVMPTSPLADSSPAVQLQLMAAQQQPTRGQQGQVYYPNQPYLPQQHIQRGGPSIPSPIPEGRPSRRELQLPASALAAAAAEFGSGQQGAGGGGGGGSGTPSRRTSSYGRSSSHAMWPGGVNTALWSTASAASGLALTGGLGAALASAPAPAVGGGTGASGASGGGLARWQPSSFTVPMAGLVGPALPLSGGSTAANQYSRTTASASGAAGAADGSPRSGPGAAAAAASVLAAAAVATPAADGGGGVHAGSRYLGGFQLEDAGGDSGPKRSSHSLQARLPPPQLPSPGKSAAGRPLPSHHSGPLPLHHLEPHLHPHPTQHHLTRLPPSLRRTADGHASGGVRCMGSPNIADKHSHLGSAGYDDGGGRVSAAGMGTAATAGATSGPLMSSGAAVASSGDWDRNSSGALQRLGHSGSGAALYVSSLRNSAGPPPVLGAVAELGSMAEGEEGEEAGDGEDSAGQATAQDGGRRRSISGLSGRARLLKGGETNEHGSAPITYGNRSTVPAVSRELRVDAPMSYRTHKPDAAVARAAAGGSALTTVRAASRPLGGGDAGACGTPQAAQTDDPAAAAAVAGYSSPFALNGWLRAVVAQELAASSRTGVTAPGIDSAQEPGSASAGPSQGAGSISAGPSFGIGMGSAGASTGNTACVFGPVQAAMTATRSTAAAAAGVMDAGSGVSWACASLSLRCMPAQSNAHHHHHLQAQNPSEVVLMHAVIGAGTAGSAVDNDARLTVVEDDLEDGGGPHGLRTGSGSRRLRAAGSASTAATGEGGHAAPGRVAPLSALGRPPRVPQRALQRNGEPGSEADATAAGLVGDAGGGGDGNADGLSGLSESDQGKEPVSGVAGGARANAAPVPPPARAALQPLPPLPNSDGAPSLPPPSALTLRPHSVIHRVQQPHNLPQPDAAGTNTASLSSPRDGSRPSQLDAAAFLEPYGAVPKSASSRQVQPAPTYSRKQPGASTEAASSPQQLPPRWPPWRAFTMSGVPGTQASTGPALLALRPGSSRAAVKSATNDSSALHMGLLQAPSLLAKRLFGGGGGAAASATSAAPSSADTGTGAGSPVSLPQSPAGPRTGSRAAPAGSSSAVRGMPHGQALVLAMGQHIDQQAVDSSGSATVYGGSGYPGPGTPGSACGAAAAPSAALTPVAALGVGQGASGRLTERTASVLGARSLTPVSGRKLRSRRQRPSGAGGLPETEVDLASVLLRRGPADRRTFRQSLLQLCYSQHATATAVGGAAGRATVRHGSVTALLSPLAALVGGAGGTTQGSGTRRGARALAARESVITPELLAATGSAAPSLSAQLGAKGFSGNATGVSSSRGGVATSSADDSDRVAGTTTGTSGDELSYAAVSGRGSAASAGIAAAVRAGGSAQRHVVGREGGGDGGPVDVVPRSPAQPGLGAPAARMASANAFARHPGSAGALPSLGLPASAAAAAAYAGGSPGVGPSLGPTAPLANAVDVESEWEAVQCSPVLDARYAPTRTAAKANSVLAEAPSSLLSLPRDSAAGKGGLASREGLVGVGAGTSGPGPSVTLQAAPNSDAQDGAGVSRSSSRRGGHSNVHLDSSGAARAGSSTFMQLVRRVRSLVTGTGGGSEGRGGSRRACSLAPSDGEVQGRWLSHSRHARQEATPLPPAATRSGTAKLQPQLQPLEMPPPDADVYEPRISDPSPRAGTPAAAAATAAAAAVSAAAATAAKSFRRGKQLDATAAARTGEGSGAAGGGGNADVPWMVPSGLDDPTGLLVRRAVSHTTAMNHMRGSRRMAALQRRLPYLEAAARAHTLGRPYQVGPSAAALAVAARGAANAREGEALPPSSAHVPTPGGSVAVASLPPSNGGSEGADGAPACEHCPDAAGGSGRPSGLSSGRPTGSSSATAGAAAWRVSICGLGDSDDGSGTSTAATTQVVPAAASVPSFPHGAGPSPPGNKRAVSLGTAAAPLISPDPASVSAVLPSARVKSQRLQPPPKLADAALVRRRHSLASLATLWPGAYQNPLAAYGPAGPSRFLAAEVLHELTTAADTAAGLGVAPAAGVQGAAVPEDGNTELDPQTEDGPVGSEPSGWKAISGALRGVWKLGGGSSAGNRGSRALCGPSFEVLRASGKLPGAAAAADTPALAPGVDAVSSGVQRSAMSMTQLRDAMRQGSFTAAGSATAAAMVAAGGAVARSAVFGTQMQVAVLAQMQAQQAAAAQQAAGQMLPDSPQLSGRIASVGQGRYAGMSPHASSLASRTAPNNTVAAAAGGPQFQPSPRAPASPRDMSMSLHKSRTSSGMCVGGTHHTWLQGEAAFPARVAATAHGFQGPPSAAAAVFAGAPHLQHSHSSRSHQSHNSVTSGATVLQRLLPARRISGSGLQPPHGSHGPVPLCFRGFRVRIGVSSGLAEGRDVIWVKASGRVAYSGHCMQLTKLVADAGMGGMVLLSGDAWERLQPWPEALTHAKALHCGRYELTDAKDTAGASFPMSAPMDYGGGVYWAHGRRGGVAGGGARAGSMQEVVTDVFQVTNSALLPRLAHWEQDGCACGLRHGRRLVPGIVDAPLGSVTFVCVGVVGLPVLRAWDAACAAESLTLWEGAVLDTASAWEGHPAALSDGVALIAFHEPVFALAFVIALQASLREEVVWPETLLEHSLGEPLDLPAVRFRGLRTRATAETADHVRFDVRAATSGALYLNQAPKALKRLRAMVARARMGQLLCRGGVAVELLRAAGRAAAALGGPGGVQRLDSTSTAVTMSQAAGGASLTAGGMLAPANQSMSVLSHAGSQGGRITPRGSFGGLLSLVGRGSQRAFLSNRNSQRGGAGSGAGGAMALRSPSLANARASSATLGLCSRSSSEDDVLAELPKLLGPAPVVPLVSPSLLQPAVTALPAGTGSPSPPVGDTDAVITAAMGSGSVCGAAVFSSRSSVVRGPGEELRLTNSSAAVESGAAGAAAAAAGAGTSSGGTGTVGATFSNNAVPPGSPSRAAVASAIATPLLPHLHVRSHSLQPQPSQQQNAPNSAASPVEEIAQADDSAAGAAAAADVSLSMALARGNNRSALLVQLLQRVSILPVLEEAPQAKSKRTRASMEIASAQQRPPARAANVDEACDPAPGKPGFSQIDMGTSEPADGPGTAGTKVLEALLAHRDDSVVRLARVGEEGAGGPPLGGGGASDSGGGGQGEGSLGRGRGPAGAGPRPTADAMAAATGERMGAMRLGLPVLSAEGVKPNGVYLVVVRNAV